MKIFFFLLILSAQAWPQDPAQKTFEFIRAIHRGEVSSPLSQPEQLKILEDNIRTHPTHAMSYHLLATMLLADPKQEHIKKAQGIIAKGIKVSPHHRGLYIVYLRTLMELGKREEISRALPKVLMMGQFQDLRDYTYMSEIYLMLNEPAKAIDVLIQGKPSMKSPWEKEELYKALGIAYQFAKKYESCAEAYRVVLHLKPKNAFVHAQMPVCLVGMKKIDEAISLTKSTHPDEEGARCEVMAKLHLIKGDEYLAQKNFDLAYYQYEHSLAQVPMPLAYLGLAGIAYARADQKKARKYIDEGAKIVTKEDENYYPLAAHIFEGNWGPYVDILKIGVTKVDKPLNQLWAYNKIGFGLHKLQRREELYGVLDKAIAIGEELLKNDPTNRLAYFHLGSSYSLYGTDAANRDLLVKGIGLLKKSREMDPHDPTVAPVLNHSQQVVDLIDSGKIPKEELNWNLKIKKPVN